jgi:ribosomal protein S18 acetylase RimI-like enzyme
VIAIRRAVAADANAIAEVHVASWRTTYPGIVDQSFIETVTVETRAAAWTKRLENPEPSAPDVLVAETADGRVVAFISGGHIREPFPGFDAELHAIYMLKEFQGAGLGRRLACEWAKLSVERGFSAAVVRVLAANPARFFYEKLGARRLKESQHPLGGKPYTDVWYGWDDIRVLTT